MDSVYLNIICGAVMGFGIGLALPKMQIIRLLSSIVTNKSPKMVLVVRTDLKIVLKTDSEEELQNLQIKSKSLGLINCVIHDAGRTQLVPGTSTVLGIGPGPATEVDLVTSHLKLL